MNQKKALLVGATGLVGNLVLQLLLKNSFYSEITILVRNRFIQTHRKLKVIETDFTHLDEKLNHVSSKDIFCCLGTTIKKAGSEEAFKKVDYSLVLEVAKLIRKQGAEQFIVISAMGANSSSKFFYNRIKGEMEEALKELGYPCLRIVRPSLLLGHRDEFRLAERIGIIMSPFWKLFLVGSLKKYCPVEAKTVARFMVKVANEELIEDGCVYENDLILQHNLHVSGANA
ncbi:MAG: NAD(P)H-binding protein [Proteobacteria bacterium]|nr:NAD(P)H-binding protein [Pseudomonadota bacterium]